MKDHMTYKGYFGSVHYSDEDQVFFGKIEFIKSLISFEGEDVKSLKASFQQSVEDYLETCREAGISPEKSFKGSFNVRIGSDLHREAFLCAQGMHDMNLNKLTKKALEFYLRSLSGRKNLQTPVHIKKSLHKNHSVHN